MQSIVHCYQVNWQNDQRRDAYFPEIVSAFPEQFRQETDLVISPPKPLFT